MSIYTQLAYKLKMKYPNIYNTVDYKLLTEIVYDAHIALQGVINISDLHNYIIENCL